MLDEKKGTCCHKCGHVHVKGTKCPTPYLKGERSCVRRVKEQMVKEVRLTKHYVERKSERGVVGTVEVLDKKAYGNYNKQEADSKILTAVQSELNKRLTEMESKEYLASNNFNIGYRFFMPVLVGGGVKSMIKMNTSKGSGNYHFITVVDDTVTTLMLSSQSKEGLLRQIEDHIRRKFPQNSKESEVRTTQNFIYEIDIDTLFGVEKEKPKGIEVSEKDLDYKIRTDYRVGATFEHSKYGKGTIVATSSGSKGTGDSGGTVDWIDVKYDKPVGVKKDASGNIIRNAQGNATPIYIKRFEKLMTRVNPRLKEELEVEVYETDQYCLQCLAEYIEAHSNILVEAEYRGRKVSLGKPFLTPGGPKKRSVYVKNAKENVIKVNFGDPNLKIKKSNPKRRKSFRARHKCHTAKDRTTPRYWSCKFW